MEIQKLELSSNDLIKCDHCGESSKKCFEKNQHFFCCKGCAFVYDLLKKNKLEDFYSQFQDNQKANSIKNIKEKPYEFLDNKSYQEKWITKTEHTEQAVFFVEGVHCIACLWILEKINQIMPEIVSSRLCFEDSTLTLIAKRNTKWSDVAKLIQRLGYPPHPLNNNDELKTKQREEDKALLIKTGVAAACAMNIMLYSVSIYSGASEIYSQKFNLINIFLSLPVVLYSSIPFYKSALAGIRNKMINIDVPIAFAIIAAFSISVYNVSAGNNITYFDTIASLVFFVLFSRYILRKVQSFTHQENNLKSIIQNQSILKYNLNTGDYEPIPSEGIEAGDKIKILSGQSLPVDARLLTSNTKFQTAAITGEAYPKTFQQGENLPSGYIAQSECKLECLSNRENSYLFSMFTKVKENWQKRSPITMLTDKAAKYLVSISLILATAILLYFSFNGQYQQGLNRFLAIIVITCPCALGLATPLMLAKGLSIASKNGIMMKDQKTLEALSKVNNVFFDKTGTITKGDFQVLRWTDLNQSSTDYSNFDLANWLQSKSTHPIASGIQQYIGNLNHSVEVISLDFENNANTSPIGKINEQKYYFKSIEGRDVNEHELYLMENNLILSHITLSDPLKEDAMNNLRELSDQNYQLYLLSGDTDSKIHSLVTKYHLPFKKFLGGLSPKDKEDLVAATDHSYMIGDGINDTLAFSKASVSATINGSMEVGLNASDIYFSKPDLELVNKSIELSKQTMSVIKRNLVFSFIYNFFGAGLAAFGYITPLFAAIFMPLSSITVTLSCLVATKYLNHLNKEVSAWKL
tara:strand:- start:113940 stop:116360 length:2421 start_codon:yes stop_codon:yes gene_type:complete